MRFTGPRHTPPDAGTDDGRGVPRHTYAPGLREGDRVVAGQLLGWLGDSGNAEATTPHVHAELRLGSAFSGPACNLAPSVRAARVLSAPVDGAGGLSRTPRGVVDEVRRTADGDVLVRGWALDPDTQPRPARVAVTVGGASTEIDASGCVRVLDAPRSAGGPTTSPADLGCRTVLAQEVQAQAAAAPPEPDGDVRRVRPAPDGDGSG